LKVQCFVVQTQIAQIVVYTNLRRDAPPVFITMKEKFNLNNILASLGVGVLSIVGLIIYLLSTFEIH
jgi:hypothetical protein